MTVPVQNPYNSYNANGSTTQFRYEFLIKDESDLSVTLDGAAVDKSKYTLTNVGQSNGGDVKFTTAPVAGSLIIRRAVIAQRLTDYQDNGPLRAEDVNRDFDRVVMMIQDKQADADTSLKHPLGQNGTSAPYTYDANGGRIIDLGTPTADTDAATKKYVDDLYVDKAAQAVRQAEAARDAAAVSASAAAASQQSASSSQSAASGSQTAAKTSETNAANSASAATASASAAAGSASTASTAAGTATGAATTATQAASGATQQANQASGSATAAGNSAAAAAGSATTAGQQAGAAAGSATAAFNAQKAAEKARDEAINVAPGNYMLKTNNLSDLTNKATARTNLSLERIVQAPTYTYVESPAGSKMIIVDGGGVEFQNDNHQTIGLPVTSGGTGAMSALDARINLGLRRFSEVTGSVTAMYSGAGKKAWTIDDSGKAGVYDYENQVYKPVTIDCGGTGAGDAAGARTNLGLGSFFSNSSDAFVRNPTNLNQFIYMNSSGRWGAYDSVASKEIALGVAQGGTGATTTAGAARSLKVMGDGLPENQLGKPYLSSGVYYCGDTTDMGGAGKPFSYAQILNIAESAGESGNWHQIAFSTLVHAAPRMRRRNANPPTLSDWWTFVVLGLNTTIDTNGFYKTASPVIKLKGDGTAETNQESEGATVERLGVGEYRVEGVLGFNSDPAWGGTSGGFVVPHNGNGLPLLWVDYDVAENGDLIIKTYHREHLNVPEYARNHIEGVSDGDPVDIPAGRWIDLRVEMPGDSVYNTNLKAAEEDAAEREKEYNKRAAEAAAKAAKEAKDFAEASKAAEEKRSKE